MARDPARAQRCCCSTGLSVWALVSVPCYGDFTFPEPSALCGFLIQGVSPIGLEDPQCPHLLSPWIVWLRRSSKRDRSAVVFDMRARVYVIQPPALAPTSLSRG